MEGTQLAQIFKGKIIDTYNYEKHDRAKDYGTKTGKTLHVETSPYAVIDFDVYTDKMKKILNQKICINFKNKAKIVETYSGGFHIYVKDDGIWNDLDKNRPCGVYHSEETHMSASGLKNDYAIDVFLSHHHDKRNLVVLPTSLVKTEKSNNEIREYKLIYDCDDDKLISFSEALNLLDSRMNIKINKPSNEKKKDSFKNLIKEIEGEIKDIKNEKEYKQATISKELFDIIVKGFEGVEIHGESEDIEREIGVLQIITALNACENDEISKEDIEKAFDFIERNGNLTSKAQERFGEICYRNRNIKADTWQQLFKMIRIHNKTYFNKYIVPVIDPKKQFIEGNYTFNKYLANYHKFTTKYQHMNALSKCIAVNNDGGGYIRKSVDGDNIVYQLISCALMKKEFNKKIVLPTTEKEKEKMKEQKKKVQDFKEYKLFNVIQDAEAEGKLMQFNGMSLTPSNSTVLWQYRPPTGTNYNKELIEEWIEFMRSRVIHERPLMEELYSHAYRFRNPAAFNEKFFVHYEAKGNSGKSFLAGCLALLYPRLANVGTTPDQIADLHCTLFSQNLLVWMEEAEKGTDYTNSKLQTAIKRVSTINGSERALYTASRAVINCAIAGMNTNDSTLYGLIRADRATKSRMVIVEFKPTIYTPAEFRKIADYYTKNVDFAYSLYKYLKEDLEIPDDFTVSRYEGTEKDEFIKNAQTSNRNNFEMILELLVQRFNSGFADDYITQKTFRKGDYIFGSRDKLIEFYKRYNETKSPLSDDRIHDSLLENGWEYKKIRIGEKTIWAYIIEYEKFKRFAKDNVESDDEVDEDFCIDE